MLVTNSLEKSATSTALDVNIPNQSTQIAQEKYQFLHDSFTRLFSVKFCMDDGGVFIANKLTIATKVPFFKALLYGTGKEAEQEEVRIQGDNSKAFQAFLRFLHTGHVKLDRDNLVPLFILADKYCVISMLEERCLTLAASQTKDVELKTLAVIYSQTRSNTSMSKALKLYGLRASVKERTLEKTEVVFSGMKEFRKPECSHFFNAYQVEHLVIKSEFEIAQGDCSAIDVKALCEVLTTNTTILSLTLKRIDFRNHLN